MVDYVTFPQLFFPAELLFVFSTFRDRLRILVVYDRDAFGPSLHEELFRPFLDRLGELAGLDFSSASTRDGVMASWEPGREAAGEQHGAPPARSGSRHCRT